MPTPESGKVGRPPPPPEPSSVVPLLRPRSSFKRRLTLRQISSRSGGPPEPRLPHWGSFSDIEGGRTGRTGSDCVGGRRASSVEGGRGAQTGKRGIGRKSLGQRSAQIGTAGTRQCAQTNAADYTRLVALDSGGKIRGVHLVHHPDLRHTIRA